MAATASSSGLACPTKVISWCHSWCSCRCGYRSFNFNTRRGTLSSLHVLVQLPHLTSLEIKSIFRWTDTLLLSLPLTLPRITSLSLAP